MLKALFNLDVLWGNFFRLIAELTRMVILRRGCLRSPDGRKNITVTLGINKNRELIYLLHEDGQCNEPMEPVDQQSFESILKSHQMNNILCKSNLSSHLYPNFFEQGQYGFSVLTKLAGLYPELIVEMIFGHKP